LLVIGGAAIAVVLALGLWVLLSRDPIAAGDVLDHRFEAAHTTTTFIPQYITICSGNPPVCRQQFSYMLPITSNHPDEWALLIDPYESDRDPEWITVSQADHDRYRIGDRWLREPQS
jgi:hypothetical protein